MQIYYCSINIPLYVQDVLAIFEANGFEAFIVGGCVRDSLLGLVPKDWDITTNALPHQVCDLFSSYPHNQKFKFLPLAPEHGTVGICMYDQGGVVEITTYRIEGEYYDSRHPSSITFTTSLQSDLKRRDFSFNALVAKIALSVLNKTQLAIPLIESPYITGAQAAYNKNLPEQIQNLLLHFFTHNSQEIYLNKFLHSLRASCSDDISYASSCVFIEIYDYYGGVQDLKQKRIVCVGNARQRFLEDPLRIMRAIRFSAVLPFCFSLEEETRNALFKLTPELNKISKERLESELQKLLFGEYATDILIEYQSVVRMILPELNFLSQEQFVFNCIALGYAPNILGVRLALLFSFAFCDISFYEKYLAMCKSALKQLRCTKKHIAHTLKILSLINMQINNKIELKKLLANNDEEIIFCLLFFYRAIAMAFENKSILDQKIQNKHTKNIYSLSHIHFLFELLQEVFDNKECYKLKHLPINGSDIISIARVMQKSIKGKDVGDILQRLLQGVICDEISCTREVLLEKVQLLLQDAS